MPDKSAIVQELYNRVDTLPPDKAAIVTELAKRLGVQQVPNAGAQMRAGALGKADEQMQWDNPFAFVPPDNRGFLESARDAVVGGLKGLVHIPRANEIGPTLGAEDTKDLPIQTVATVDQQARAGNYRGALGTVAGTGAAIALPIAAGEAANAGARALGRAISPAARNTAADALRASAEKNIDTAINPTTRVNKALVRDKLAPGIIDRGMRASSLADLQAQAQAGMETHGARIDEIFDQHAAKGTKLNPAPILDALEAEKQEYTVAGQKINPAYVDKLSELQDQIQKVGWANGGDIPLDQLRRIKQVNDEIVAKSKGAFALPPDAQSAVAAHKLYGNAIRSAFADSVPELTEPSREFNFHADLDKVVGDSLLRKTGQRAPLTQKLGEMVGTGIGSYAGPAGAIVGNKLGGALGRLENSTIWNTLSAQVKNQVAERLRVGDTPGALMAVAKATKGAPAAAANTPQGSLALTAASVPSSELDLNAQVQPNASGARGEGGSVSGAPGGGPAETIGGASSSGTGASAETLVRIPGKPGLGYQATYKVKELSDLQASHDGLTFQANPKYGPGTQQRDYSNAANQAKIVNWSTPAEFDPSYHVNDNPDASNGPPIIDSDGNVLGGNGRVAIMQRVYSLNKPGAAAYRALLERKAAQFGIDPASLAGMKKPVLVRELPDSLVGSKSAAQGAIADFNVKPTAELTPAERAISDSRQVSQGTLDHVAGRLEAKGSAATIAQVIEGKPGLEVLDRLIADGVVSPQERAAFADKEGLTEAGRDRIAALMIGRYFEHPKQLETVPGSIKNQVERIAAPLAQVDGSPEWSLTPAMKEALNIIDAADKLRIKNVDDFIKQEGLFGSEKYSAEGVALARALKRMSAEELKAAARQYAADASYAGRGSSMFGNDPTPAASFAAAFEDRAADSLARKAVRSEAIGGSDRGLAVASIESGKPEIGPHGPIFREYAGNTTAAVTRLLKERTGEARGALVHKEMPPVDLIWGEPGESSSKGYGLAKIEKFHPEVLQDLGGIYSRLRVVERNENTIQLEDARYRAVVRRNWKGSPKDWLLTAFEKRG